MTTTETNPLPAHVGDEVVFSRDLDEFPVGTRAIVTASDPTTDSYQLRIQASGHDQAALVEARRSDFQVVINTSIDDELSPPE